MNQVEHISIYIARTPGEVYDYASDPRNLPEWAAGLARSGVIKVRNVWVAEAPFGRVTISFAHKNEFGVMDHQVELESGAVFYNPMRVVANAEGSELTFTLFRQPDMSSAQFAEDKQAVLQDLKKLKDILEGVDG